MKRPGTKCNARLHRGDGYCDNGSGYGTDHPGHGRCRLHGGDNQADGPEELFRAAGLDFIIDLAETMQHDDQEYLMEVGNNALVVTRSKILARLQDPTLTPKEVGDYTSSLVRVDNMIIKHPNGMRGEDGVESGDTGDDAEFARVLALRESNSK